MVEGYDGFCAEDATLADLAFHGGELFLDRAGSVTVEAAQEDFHACCKQRVIPDELLLQDAVLLEDTERRCEMLFAVHVVDARARQVALYFAAEALVSARPGQRQTIRIIPQLHNGRDDERQ